MSTSGARAASTLRVLETAARHAEDVPLGAEHILLALVLEVPDLALARSASPTAGSCSERLAGLLDGPERPRSARGRDIAILEAALRNAQESGADEVTPQHLLLGLLEVAPDVVARAAVDLAAIEGDGRAAWRVAGRRRAARRGSTGSRGPRATRSPVRSTRRACSTTPTSGPSTCCSG